MITVFIVGLCVLIGGWVLVAAVGSGPIVAMHRVTVAPVSAREMEAFVAKVLSSGSVDAQWLSMSGFHPLGAYRVHRMPGIAGLVVWKKEDERTYLCAYLLTTSELAIDFVTMCNAGIFTTGKSKDSQLLPSSPGNYVQSFTATPAVLYRRHQEGLQTLSRLDNMVPLESDGTFEDDFTSAMYQQAEYIRSLALWPLRIPWWYFVRRFQRHEKTLSQLKKAGLV